MLAVSGISRSIGSKEIFKNVSFSVDTGEILALVGPSGAGKSSVLRTLALLDAPDRGSISIGATTYSTAMLHKSSLKESLYPDLTIVFQQLFVWPHLTVRENLLLPHRGTLPLALFSELVDTFDMSGYLDSFPNEISLGQRQRTSLARALLLRPRYLLLDEVTSALDCEHTLIVMRYLRKLVNEGLTCVVVTHNISQVAALCDKVVFMVEGVVVESGGTELLSAASSSRFRQFLGL